MILTGFILLATAFIIAGYMLSSRLTKTVADVDRSPEFANNPVFEIRNTNFQFPDTVKIISRPLTPKEYGERFGTGASRNKRTNRLKFRK
ncbi:Uncharacterised protein [Sphingobacterium multivorum]|uniref:hypothetical protein n=1 Tax=Sphingobacterium multivorum TaxID=28454 RepID=UPI000DFDF1A6|nr:hypothetical protein [Sphingobacterium multivorum]QQT43376.1 hypothetical protein I6J00_16660 [Sphingobacterium multivorum]SUI98416.1 Uncharacterised protein [Sphingobacterium multivorum]